MLHSIALWFLFAALFMSGLLAGVSLDKSFVQLPARSRLGITAYAAYSRAADLGPGIFWYPLLGIGAPLLILATAALIAMQHMSLTQSFPIYLSTGLALCHVFLTSRAAPVMLSLRKDIVDKPTLDAIFQRFAFRQGIRGIVQGATFITLIWSLVVYMQQR